MPSSAAVPPLTWSPTGLPVEGSLEEIGRHSTDAVVVTAAPGAGKSTLIPLAVANAIEGPNGKVVVLEPRRLAARATAARLAQLIDSSVGDEVGLTVRGERRVGPACRIEVVTEAVLTNRLQADPELPGVGALVFDEFHERNLHSDLSLAMALESKSAIRPDLGLVVMSATMTTGPVATALGTPQAPAPVVDVAGRSFPIETVHLARPARNRWATAVAGAVHRALDAVAGDVLVFAPGRGEIDRVIRALEDLPPTIEAIGLHGGSPPEVQRSVLAPGRRRRVIVATAVAETSITIPTVEAVVDGGLLRRAAFDPLSGLGRLETIHATRFAADQRRGRAGRVGPGVCFRLWSVEDHRLLEDAAPPEIVDGDPLPVAFELARWGDPAGESLPLLDHPGPARLAFARQQLTALGLVDDAGALTGNGRTAATLPLDPRLASLAVTGRDRGSGTLAAVTSAVLAEDIRTTGTDLGRAIDRHRGDRNVQRTLKRLERTLRLDRSESATTADLDELLAAAWPDRVAMARHGRPGRFLLAAGREVEVPERDPLAGAEWLIVASADGIATAARVRSAVPTDRATVLEACADRIRWEHDARWDERSGRIVAERVQRLGAIVLHREPDPSPDPDALQRAVADAIRAKGTELFRWSDAATKTRHRLAWLHEQDPAAWPAVDDAALLADLDQWLDLARIRRPSDVANVDLGQALLGRLGWRERAAFDELAPRSIALPGGREARIDYASGRPVLAVRLQWLFGLDEHPCFGPHRAPVTIELLSPAGRPAQTTTDLPGFWRGSYQAVRSDLRGRYPKHSWPEDPLI